MASETVRSGSHIIGASPSARLFDVRAPVKDLLDSAWV